MKKFNNYNNELNFLIKNVKKAYKIIKKEDISVSEKGIDDVVTNLDLKVEKFLISEINKNFPEYDIVSEEFNSQKVLTKKCFTIDPIDGTRNFANNIPIWGIQTACISEGQTVVSVLYLPKTNDLFYAVKGEGSYHNGKRIYVSKHELKNCIYATDSCSGDIRKVIVEEMNKHTKHYRVYGAVCFAYSLVASGSISGHIFGKYTAWDVTPGVLLCQEAGGIAYQKNENYVIVASDKKVLDMLKKATEKGFANN